MESEVYQAVCTRTSLPIIAALGLLVCMDIEIRICCYPIER